MKKTLLLLVSASPLCLFSCSGKEDKKQKAEEEGDFLVEYFTLEKR